LLKFAFTFVSNDDLLFLLKPTDAIVRLLTGSSSFYLAENGYYHKELHILIDKSCSGFNFWILYFLLFSFLTLKYVDKPLHKILVISISLVFAYILTIFVNASRIFVSIVVKSQINLFSNQPFGIDKTENDN